MFLSFLITLSFPLLQQIDVKVSKQNDFGSERIPSRHLANVDTNGELLLSNRPSCVHFVVNEAKANAGATLCVIRFHRWKPPPPSFHPQGITEASFFQILTWLTLTHSLPERRS